MVEGSCCFPRSFARVRLYSSEPSKEKWSRDDNEAKHGEATSWRWPEIKELHAYKWKANDAEQQHKPEATSETSEKPLGVPQWSTSQ